MDNGSDEDDSRDFVIELRVRVPKGLSDLVERSLRDLAEVTRDMGRIGRAVVTSREAPEKSKVKKMEIK